MKDGLQDLASTIMKMKSFTSEVEWAFLTTLNPGISIDSIILFDRSVISVIRSSL
jgi:hypothetical protein